VLDGAVNSSSTAFYVDHDRCRELCAITPLWILQVYRPGQVRRHVHRGRHPAGLEGLSLAVTQQHDSHPRLLPMMRLGPRIMQQSAYLRIVGPARLSSAKADNTAANRKFNQPSSQRHRAG